MYPTGSHHNRDQLDNSQSTTLLPPWTLDLVGLDTAGIRETAGGGSRLRGADLQAGVRAARGHIDGNYVK